jgi:hypothetical protein
MNLTMQNHVTSSASARDAEETLRLIANLPAPEGLEDRIHAALATVPHRARVLSWPSDTRWIHGTLGRAAAAAAIVCVVAGGSWQVYSRVHPAHTPEAIAAPHIAAPGGFSSANAIRKPKTLDGPTLTHPLPGPMQVHGVGKTAANAAKMRTKSVDSDPAKASEK